MPAPKKTKASAVSSNAPLAAASVASTTSQSRVAETPGSALSQAIVRNLNFTLARDHTTATPRDWWIATSLAVREHILARLIRTQGEHNKHNARRLYYFSLEYLMGRLFENNLYNTGLYDEARASLKDLGVDWESVRESEVDMGLGNGGLGRLAACFLDSLATLDLPAIGYGIHYRPPGRASRQLDDFRHSVGSGSS
jgi:starch phosphorylase